MKLIPKGIFDKYNLKGLVNNDRGLVKIRKGMYNLPQAGKLAYDKLLTHLSKSDHIPTSVTASLFKHCTKPITFCLIVNDFEVKYTHHQDAIDLIAHLNKEYTTVTNWKGNLFSGICLQWNYTAHTVDLSMPTFVPEALKRFDHPSPVKPQHLSYP